MKYQVQQFSFKEGNDYLDVEVHAEEEWVELKIETSNSFPIQSQKDLDFIYQKLTEVFSSFEKN
jgi:2-oxoglutarate dehydrogenase complex dehydrogenase (E1) component-like enzyme